MWNMRWTWYSITPHPGALGRAAERFRPPSALKQLQHNLERSGPSAGHANKQRREGFASGGRQGHHYQVVRRVSPSVHAWQ